MRRLQALLYSFGLTLTSPQILADINDLPPPDMSQYMAYQAPKPPLNERAKTTFSFLEGWYLTGGVGYSLVDVNGIDNDSNAGAGVAVPTTVKSNISESQFVPAIALGYQLRKSGFLSRLEISYLPIYGIAYDANPFLNLTGIDNQINSKVDSNLVLFKAYDDFNLDMPIMPYVQAGIGAAINKVSGSSVINFIPGLVTANGNVDSSKTNLAGDIGAGVRWNVSPNIAVGLGYEFDYLGKANWDINYIDTLGNASNVTLNSGSSYANTILATISWMPVAKTASSEMDLD